MIPNRHGLKPPADVLRSRAKKREAEGFDNAAYWPRCRARRFEQTRRRFSAEQLDGLVDLIRRS